MCRKIERYFKSRSILYKVPQIVYIWLERADMLVMGIVAQVRDMAPGHLFFISPTVLKFAFHIFKKIV